MELPSLSCAAPVGHVRYVLVLESAKLLVAKIWSLTASGRKTSMMSLFAVMGSAVEKLTVCTGELGRSCSVNWSSLRVLAMTVSENTRVMGLPGLKSTLKYNSDGAAVSGTTSPAWSAELMGMAKAACPSRSSINPSANEA